MLLNLSEVYSNFRIFSAADTGLSASLEQGVSIGIIGISVVFLGLVILFFFMKLFVYILNLSSNKQQRLHRKISDKTEKEIIPHEVVAAITLAIQHSREEFHDLEETILTMQRITRPYSPWSSKIHGLRYFVR